MSRRRILLGAGALSGLALLPSAMIRRIWTNPVFPAYPFSLGIASGDPQPDGVVLWTRIAPEPFDGSMPYQAVEVAWEVASDEKFRHVVQSGTELARPELGHSIHAEVSGLEPAREYFYRFIVGNEKSRTGRTKTAPAAGADVARLRFGLAGCQHWEQGYYTAYRHMAAEDLDFVFHYGDYIYEDRATGAARPSVRQHNGDEVYALAAYRNRYALYKSDPDLQAAHAAFPFLVSYDDHEIDNNWAGAVDQDNTPPEVFLLRRAAAFQAWYENMPVRKAALPTGPDILAYRRLAFGTLLEVSVLDTRQYRSDQPCGDGVTARCPAALAPDAPLLGPAQERWLLTGLGASRARWNVLAQQVMLVQLDRDAAPEAKRYSMDKWDGYSAARKRLLAHMMHAKVPNPVVLTGDAHSNWVGELKADFDDPDSQTIGVEFVGTSISSGGDGADTRADTAAVLSQNPHVKFFNDQRGYVSFAATPEQLTANFRIVPFVGKPDAPVATRASFVVEHGRTGVTAT